MSKTIRLLPNLIEFLLKNLITILFTFSLLALTLMYVLQYFFDFHPCILCVYQRIPYFIIIFVIALRRLFTKNYLYIILSILLLLEASIAFYHAGVEHGIFQGTFKCNLEINQDNLSIEDLKQTLLAGKAKDCKTPSYLIPFISIAEMNFIISTMLFLSTAYITRKNYVSTR